MARVSEFNFTLVAFHGARKPEPLGTLLRDVERALSASSDSFEPYTLTQMHATLIGMEADLVDGRLLGHWFRKNRQQSREISIDRLHRLLQEFVATDEPLFRIRFGGFPECFCTCRAEHPQACGQWTCATAPSRLDMFHSCDRTPYEGSFYGVAPGPAMITGWPVPFTHSLYEFRRSLEQAGFADKYHYAAHHEKAHWKNDDCFIRVGTFPASLPTAALRDIQHQMRTFFANLKPVVVDITPADVALIRYAHPGLREHDVLARIPLSTFLKDPSVLE